MIAFSSLSVADRHASILENTSPEDAGSNEVASNTIKSEIRIIVLPAIRRSRAEAP
jgi:hypothetical protein